MKAKQIIANLELNIGTASASDIRAIYHAADDEGIIQSDQMVRLFRGQPERHTTCRMRQALLWAGCEEV